MITSSPMIPPPRFRFSLRKPVRGEVQQDNKRNGGAKDAGGKSRDVVVVFFRKGIHYFLFIDCFQALSFI